MATPKPDPNRETSLKASEERQQRLLREAADIAEARGELDSGLYVDANEIDDWIDSIGARHELPPPPTRRRVLR